jgi:hypothetical protein
MLDIKFYQNLPEGSEATRRNAFKLSSKVPHSSPSIVMLIKSRRIRWARHVIHVGEMRYGYKILVGNLKGRDLGVDRSNVLEGILEKYVGKL